jgi:hypothetical protein
MPKLLPISGDYIRCLKFKLLLAINRDHAHRRGFERKHLWLLKNSSRNIRKNKIASGCVISDLLGSQGIFYPEKLAVSDETRVFNNHT